MLNLNNYGNWSGPTEDEAKSLLYRFGRVNMTEKHQNKCGVTPQMLRDRNPEAKVYRHFVLCAKNNWDTDWGKAEGDLAEMQTPMPYDEIVAHDWWLRDGDEKIVTENEQTWVLDVGRRWFKETYVMNLLSRLKDSGVDGVVLDYWLDNLWLLRGRPRPKRYPTDETWAEKAWKPFVAHVVDALRSAGYRVIGNCAGEYNTANKVKEWQRGLLDGTIYEQWSHDWSGNALPVSVIDARIEAFRDDPLETWAVNFIPGKGEIADWDAKARRALAMYYIAIPDDPGARVGRSYHHCGDMYLAWDPLWDFGIGEPVEPAMRLAPGVWSRTFDPGLVLFNYSDGPADFAVPTGYTMPDGSRPYGLVRVPAKDAMILARG